jgi:hypothetical protein
MKSPEYILHGTSSEKDSGSILEKGFNAEVGRATVSGDLIYAYEWAVEQSKRKGSKSQSELGEGETGRIIVMKTPDDKHVDYATHTGVEVDDEEKQITGYSLKYVSGRKQLGIYDTDAVGTRKELESVKEKIALLKQQQSEYLEGVGIDVRNLRGEEDILAATHDFAVEEQQTILSRVEEFQAAIEQLRKDAERGVHIDTEYVALSIVPSETLGAVIQRLGESIRSLQHIDIPTYIEELKQVIESDAGNVIDSDVALQDVLEKIVIETVKTEIVNMVRTLALDVKRAQEYEVFNRGTDEKVDKTVDKEQLVLKLEKINEIVSAPDFDIGLPELNRYVTQSLKKLREELV